MEKDMFGESVANEEYDERNNRSTLLLGSFIVLSQWKHSPFPFSSFGGLSPRLSVGLLALTPAAGLQ